MKWFFMLSVFCSGCVFIMNIPALIPVGATYVPEAWKVLAAVVFGLAFAFAAMEDK